MIRQHLYSMGVNLYLISFFLNNNAIKNALFNDVFIVSYIKPNQHKHWWLLCLL